MDDPRDLVAIAPDIDLDIAPASCRVPHAGSPLVSRSIFHFRRTCRACRPGGGWGRERGGGRRRGMHLPRCARNASASLMAGAPNRRAKNSRLHRESLISGRFISPTGLPRSPAPLSALHPDLGSIAARGSYADPFYAGNPRGSVRGHQRAPSQGPVCNYRHEAWPRGRTIGPLGSLSLPPRPASPGALLFSVSLPTRWDLRSRCFRDPSAIPSNRRGISITTIDRR